MTLNSLFNCGSDLAQRGQTKLIVATTVSVGKIHQGSAAPERLPLDRAPTNGQVNSFRPAPHRSRAASSARRAIASSESPRALDHSQSVEKNHVSWNLRRPIGSSAGNDNANWSIRSCRSSAADRCTRSPSPAASSSKAFAVSHFPRCSSPSARPGEFARLARASAGDLPAHLRLVILRRPSDRAKFQAICHRSARTKPAGPMPDRPDRCRSASISNAASSSSMRPARSTVRCCCKLTDAPSAAGDSLNPVRPRLNGVLPHAANPRKLSASETARSPFAAQLLQRRQAPLGIAHIGIAFDPKHSPPESPRSCAGYRRGGWRKK